MYSLQTYVIHNTEHKSTVSLWFFATYVTHNARTQLGRKLIYSL